MSKMRSIFKLLNKRQVVSLLYLLGIILIPFSYIKSRGDSTYDKVLPNKTVNDVTQLNPIQIAQVIKPHTILDIKHALQNYEGKVSIGGGRYSMGGQIAFENSLHLDMREFNKVIEFNKESKQIKVQSGITWRQLQEYIDPYNLSVKIMQTYSNFTVGGSVSVNCHGRYIGHGPIISSVLELKIITIEGEEIVANRKSNYDVFKAAIGGYGGIGVIAEVTLQLVDNVKVERRTELVTLENYNQYFNSTIRNDSTVVFQNGDLYPPDFDMVNNVSWVKTNKELTDTTRISRPNQMYWIEPLAVQFVASSSFGKWARQNLIDPLLYSKPKIVWRNNEASYDVAELEPKSREKSTYVLQEYFIPVDSLTVFIPKMKSIYDRHEVNIINVSIRHAFPDKESYLSWANEEVFALVVYYKQGTTKDDIEQVKNWTLEITDAILSVNGKWYLPYQPHATTEQFNKAYANAGSFFQVKNRLDSAHRLTNKLLNKYDPFYLSQNTQQVKISLNDYIKGEEQTILTVPEWYLVFNPNEYSKFLNEKNNPSDFPFLESINEYWRLYDRSLKLVSKAYPYNSEYVTMLQIIGVSITIEYLLKWIYESTIGRLFSLLANDNISSQEEKIIEAHIAYGSFIYHTAWYEFKFFDWIKQVWSTSNNEDSSFIRRWERLLFFTLEFSFKAIYAQILEWGASLAYEEPSTKIYGTLYAPVNIKESKNLKVLGSDEAYKLVEITRWGAFTNEILKISDDSTLHFTDISGNDEIAVSILVDSKFVVENNCAELLYESKVVTNNSKIRQVYLVDVKELLKFIREVKLKGCEVEHVYDY